jgi:hypothetical protein
MQRSVEQSQDFHVARRVAAQTAPGWRMFATPRLAPGHYAVDHRNSTIELGEGTEPSQLLAHAMFCVGYLQQERRVRFDLLFGRGLRRWNGTDAQLLNTLAHQGALADRDALAWATRTLAAFWPATDFSNALSRCAWRRPEWLRYFSAT